MAAPADDLYELCKLHAATDGSFSEVLLRHYYEVALERCYKFLGWELCFRTITELVTVAGDGSIKLSHRSSSDVRLTSGATFIGVVPRPEGRLLLPGHMDWCCYCAITASYQVGKDPCDIDASFKQAVCRVFAYLIENRGDAEAGGQLMTRSGAIGFLRGHLDTAI